MVIGNEQRSRLSPALRQEIEAHRIRSATLREEIGDPGKAIDELVRKNFTLDVLLSGIRLDERGEWLGFADDDEDEQWPESSI